MRTGGLVGLAFSAPWNRRLAAQPRFSDNPFSLGVASGDPWPNSVVLWTRLAPKPVEGGGMPLADVEIRYRVATDDQMQRVIRDETVLAMPELAHSVHIVAGGLEPARDYWYQFHVGNESSTVGHTRTAPAADAVLSQLSFAYVSCQHYESGYFTAYKHLVEDAPDFVVHLGDYIYEGAAAPLEAGRVRQHNGPEIVTLTDYRNRYALYRTDPHLQAAHAACPWIVTWDDHEVDNNWAGTVPQDPDEQNPTEFLVRRMAAFQAYYEHMPLRSFPVPRGALDLDLRLYRRFQFGDLVQINVLDTRQYRSVQPCVPDFPGTPDCPERQAPSLSVTGQRQEAWLLSQLDASSARWNVLAQQLWFGQFDFAKEPPRAFNTDAWDGYPQQRQRILDFIDERRPGNPIVISGDWHGYCAQNLQKDFDDPDSETLATEFAGTSLSSRCPWAGEVEANLAENPHVRFFEGNRRGYVRCLVRPERWQTDFRVVSDPLEPESTSISTLASFVVEDGQPGVQEA